MASEQVLHFVRQSHRGVLATIKRDGRSQLSNMSYMLDDDGRIKMSTRGTNVKVKNIQRDPRVSVVIQGDTWGDYLVVDGRASIVEENPIPTLRKIYERVRGGAHPNWEEFDSSQVQEQRVVIDIEIDHAYPEARLSR